MTCMCRCRVFLLGRMLMRGTEVKGYKRLWEVTTWIFLSGSLLHRILLVLLQIPMTSIVHRESGSTEQKYSVYVGWGVGARGRGGAREQHRVRVTEGGFCVWLECEWVCENKGVSHNDCKCVHLLFSLFFHLFVCLPVYVSNGSSAALSSLQTRPDQWALQPVQTWLVKQAPRFTWHRCLFSLPVCSCCTKLHISASGNCCRTAMVSVLVGFTPDL